LNPAFSIAQGSLTLAVGIGQALDLVEELRAAIAFCVMEDEGGRRIRSRFASR